MIIFIFYFDFEMIKGVLYGDIVMGYKKIIIGYNIFIFFVVIYIIIFGIM